MLLFWSQDVGCAGDGQDVTSQDLGLEGEKEEKMDPSVGFVIMDANNTIKMIQDITSHTNEELEMVQSKKDVSNNVELIKDNNDVKLNHNNEKEVVVKDAIEQDCNDGLGDQKK